MIWGGDFLVSDSNSYHTECFTCSACGCNLAEDGTLHFLHNGQLYCQDDYNQFLPKCGVCCNALVGGSVRRVPGHDGMQYHAACYSCSECGKVRILCDGL